MIDRLEKLGRLLLWLSIVVVLVGTMMTFGRMRSGEAALKEALKDAEVKLAEALKPKGPQRLQLVSMGPLLYGLDQRTATGHLRFTNVSPSAGVICVRGIAKNPETSETADSLSSCHEVGAYTSVQMTVEFAGRELTRVCGKGECTLDIVDVPQTPGEKVAAR